MVRRLGSGFLLTAFFAGAGSQVLAVTPESPEVRRLVEKGLAFIEKAYPDQRLGGKCLAATALLKSGRQANHAVVADAIKACRAGAKENPEEIEEDIYSTGLAIIFLLLLDPDQHRTEIERFLKSLELRQKGNGAWGYPHEAIGDTSMTQYAVLSAWEAKQAGFDLPQGSIGRVANWLLRTQDPNGGWVYKGEDPGTFDLTKQTPVSLSMAAAGLGSTLICGNILGIVRLEAARDDLDLPPALVLVEEPLAGAAGDEVDAGLMRQAVERGSRWIQNNYVINPPQWTHYYLYALERSMSFLEMAEGRRSKEPKWYNDGFTLLAQTQREDGSWEGQQLAGDVVNTSFAVLFLLRSTRKSIERAQRISEGTLIGGRGLPRSLVDVRLSRGRIVNPALGSSVDDVVRILNDPKHADFDYLVENPDALMLSDDQKTRADQTQRLERLARRGAPEVRLVAMRSLAKTDALNVVPTLIYGLTDPDKRVAQAARDGLHFVSRKFEGVGPPDRPSQEAQRAEVGKWKAWYLTVRPDTQFDD